MKIENNKGIQLAILKQMVTLATSGFGLVAALAWNNVIQDLVNNHIKPYFPAGGSLFSLFFYAILITTLAVIVTYNLTKVVERLENMGNNAEADANGYHKTTKR